MKRIMVPLLALVLLAAGCIGAGNQHATSSPTDHSLTQQTMQTTASAEKCVCNASMDSEREISHLKTQMEFLNASLNECRDNATLLARAINVTQTRLAVLTSGYRGCLASLSACNATNSRLRSAYNTTSSELRECHRKLESAQTRLSSCEKERANLSAELETCRDVLDRTYSGSSVELLIERDYHREAIKAINDATQEIYVMMFSMLYDPDDWSDEANDLINALVQAERRGVSVHVLLENSVDTNWRAYRYLKSNGIDVSYDSPSTTLHAKVLIIDRRIVFLGSHNWSESALHWNHEVSVKIVSRKFAEELVEYFREVRSS